jgi:hypothetical protein
MALGPLVQLIGASRPHQLRRGLAPGQVEVNERGGGQGRPLPGPERGDDQRGHLLPLRGAQPVGQRPPGQVRVVDHHHQRATLGDAPDDPHQRRVQHRGAEHDVGQDRLRPRAGTRRARGPQAEQRHERRRVLAQQVGGGIGPEPAQQGRERGQHGIQRHGLVQLPARGHQHDVAGPGPLAGPGAEQRGLADTGLPADHDDLGRAVAGAQRHRVEVGQLLVAADQAGAVPRGSRRRGRQLTAQDGGVQRDRLGGRVGPEVVGEPFPRPGVGGQLALVRPRQADCRHRPVRGTALPVPRAGHPAHRHGRRLGIRRPARRRHRPAAGPRRLGGGRRAGGGGRLVRSQQLRQGLRGAGGSSPGRWPARG